MINLNNKLSGYNSKPTKKTGKKITKNTVRITLILLVLFLTIFFPLRGAYQGFKEAELHGKALATAYQNQNFGQLVSETSALKKSIQNADLSLNFLVWLKVIPIVGGYYSDMKSLTSSGTYGLTGLEKILSDLKPYEEDLGFKGQPVAGPDRLSQAIKILQKALPSLSKAEGDFKKANDEISGIDVNKYSEEFRGIKLRNDIKMAKDFLSGAYLAVAEDKDAINMAPQALGLSSPKTYLLLFQNDKEIRATGGFMTAYALIRIDKGQVTTTTSDDIYRLDEKLLATCQSKICPLSPPVPIVKYLPEVNGKPRTAWSMRDSNLSPDVPTSAKEFERMYLLLGQGFTFDGIIYIDSQVVENLIEITGPIEVYGTAYSSKIDDRCGCSNVIYELESYAEVAARGTQDRKAILGVLMQQILAKSLSTDMNKLPQVVEALFSLANEKHIIFYMQDGGDQQALSKLNWTGEIKGYDGDYLHINDSNFAGGKSNLYVDQTVTEEVNTQRDGTLKKKLIIEYKNPQPFNRWLNTINRDYVRVYVPKGSKLLSSKGSDEQVNIFNDLGKTVFEAFVNVRPQNSRKLEFEYTIPIKVSGEYKILIQKQPGSKDFLYKLKVNDKSVSDFKLESDREFKIKV